MNGQIGCGTFLMAEKDNHRIKNIYYMLSYAFQTLRKTGCRSVAVENFDNIHDLIAAILIKGIAEQIKRGLHRDYMQQKDVIAGLRGQILVAETIKQQTQSYGRLVCSFDEFVSDNPHNRALKSVMLLLLRTGNVKQENKNALKKLLNYFEEVSEILPTAIKWDALKYHRNNASYRMLLGICRLAVKGLLLTTEDGKYKLDSWLQEEVIHLLYERFVLNYYKIEHPELSVCSQDVINWKVDSGKCKYLPKMKADVILQYKDKRLIIDTKYYGQTMHRNHNTTTYHSNNLYQIYAYVKNSDINKTGNVAGMLLYAMTDEDITPDEDISIDGNLISLKTLDLGGSWETITAQLENLCSWLFAA